jgi:hypothetical protein
MIDNCEAIWIWGYLTGLHSIRLAQLFTDRPHHQTVSFDTKSSFEGEVSRRFDACAFDVLQKSSYNKVNGVT